MPEIRLDESEIERQLKVMKAVEHVTYEPPDKNKMHAKHHPV